MQTFLLKWLQIINHRHFFILTSKNNCQVLCRSCNSKKGVIRGLHFQKPKPQAKIIYVLSGKIYDVVVDLRKKSNNYLKYKSFYLNASDNKILYVPKGYAHGFLSLEENTTVCYFVNEFWSKEDEKVISWNDKSIKVNWPNIENLEILTSKKDQNVK